MALGKIRLRLHYEGCYGKPGSMHEDRSFKRIKAGQTITARFAAVGPKLGHEELVTHLAAEGMRPGCRRYRWQASIPAATCADGDADRASH
ncbi:MAG: hypothetical protein KAI47_23940 [Deltaproteobacteria bacterium]|nr:hypothetical protein [Deltaproteobacteria bacterium]